MSTKSSASGARRVATFLLSLEPEAAKGVLRHLDAKALADVGAAMTELEAADGARALVEALYKDLARELNDRSKLRVPREEDLAAMLAASLGADGGRKVLDDIRARRLDKRPFADLERARPAVLGAVLARESASVAALVLGPREPEFSAKILSTFDEDRALEVVKHIAGLAAPSAQVLRRVAEKLAAEVATETQRPAPADRASRLQTIAQVLSFTQQQTEQAVLQGLGDSGDDTVDVIREYMFTWNDLATVDKRSMQKILATVDTKTLAIALKGSPPDVEENVMNNLSTRVKDMVKDERELAGPLPLAEVLQARAETMKGVRSLMDSGEFKPARGSEELLK